MAGINFNYYKTEQYKTNVITLSFLERLDSEKVTENALLFKVLQRGCKKYPKSEDIQMALEGMYGASMLGSVSKKGDCQCLEITFTYPANEFVGDDVTTIITQLINEILFKPYLENSAFKVEYVEQEKINLEALIGGRKNDKRIYSIDQCIDKLLENELAGIPEYGYVEKIANITPQSLYKRYRELLNNAELCILLSGNFDRKTRTLVFETIEEYWHSVLDETSDIQIDGIADKNLCGDVFKSNSDEVKEFIEKMDVKQGKLAFGFSTGVDVDSDEGVALRVANSIFGGGMHSKLFNVIREEKSLAYYASSMLAPFKSLIIAASGIDFANKEMVAELMVELLYDIQNGKISDYELDSAKKALINSYKSMLDSSYGMAQFELNRFIRNSKYSIEVLIDEISKVTKQQVVEVAKKIKPNTIFFIDGKEV